MIKKLVKHGNSYALIIDKPILDLLNITPETELEVGTNGRDLVLHPRTNGSSSDIGDDEFEAALDWVNANYGNALRNLGKGA